MENRHEERTQKNKLRKKKKENETFWGDFFFWIETKRSRQKQQDIFKKGWQQRKIARCFLKILHEKQTYKKFCSKKEEKHGVSFLKKRNTRIKDIFVIFPKTKRHFFETEKEDWQKKIKKSSFKKNATNQKKHGTNKATARRKEEKNKRFATDKGRVRKRTDINSWKKWIFFGQKSEMKKNW